LEYVVVRFHLCKLYVVVHYLLEKRQHAISTIFS
jgi:hypothetical protein